LRLHKHLPPASENRSDIVSLTRILYCPARLPESLTQIFADVLGIPTLTPDNGLGMSAPKPILIYDGHCAFCRIWLDYWRQLTGDRIEYLASQEVGGRFPQISREVYSKSVQLVRADGTVASGARAVFESLGKERLYSWVAAPSELAYRIIAPHRNFFYQL